MNEQSQDPSNTDPQYGKEAYRIMVDQAMISARAHDSLAAQIGALSLQVHEAQAVVTVQNLELARAQEHIAMLEAQAAELHAANEELVTALEPAHFMIDAFQAPHAAETKPGAIIPINKPGSRK